jgi:putative (di)nucleoside polyphosphate hydrolase
MIQNHPHRAGSHLRRELVRCLACHGSTLSRVGASGKPGAVQVMHSDKVDMSALLASLVRTARKLREQHPEPAAGSSVVPERVPPLDTQYRPGVGIMLTNGVGQVFVGKRIDVIEEAWQMPQGCVDGNETPIIAAMRELLEELGTANVEVVAESSRWLQYELPSSLEGRAWDGRWRGQRQKWFLMRFVGDDREIKIATEHPEFSAWRWSIPAIFIRARTPANREKTGRMTRFEPPFVAKRRRISITCSKHSVRAEHDDIREIIGA